MNDTVNTKQLCIGFRKGKNEWNQLHSNINVSLKHGEFACLLGPNGAGKSTLIKSITGFLPIISGDALINGKSLSHYSKRSLSKVISIVFTERLKVPDMTVKEMVSLGRSPYTNFLGRLKPVDEQIICNSIKDIGISQLSNRALTTLSDGEHQKVMIAKALAQDTPIIILDEPTAFLDLPSRMDIMNLLRRLAKEKNKSILLSTHDLDLALRMADKVWLLDKGKQLAFGTPEDLILDDNFRKFFEKDGVLFDNEIGAFKIDHKNIKTIRLIGKGIEYKWVHRALTRNGYNTTSDIGNYMNVEITSNGSREYTLTHPSGVTHQYRSIEDLLRVINTIE